MLQNVTDIDVIVRNVVFDRAAVGDRFCFDLFMPVDAGVQGAGELFEQNQPFFMVEVVVDETRRAGPSKMSPTHVYGGIEISVFTMDQGDPIGNKRRVEEIGRWFSDQNIETVKFHEFAPVGAGRLRGFQRYTGTVAFKFETEPTYRG